MYCISQIDYYFIFEQVQKKNLSKLTKNLSIFYPKFFSKLSKHVLWIREIRKNLYCSGSWIRIQGSKKAPDSGSGSTTFIASVARKHVTVLLPAVRLAAFRTLGEK